MRTDGQPVHTHKRGSLASNFGRFELLDRIGVGGMAEVWRARVGGVGGFEKILVVKKILPAFAQNKTFIDMLLAEARLCAVLQHANVVQTYENGEIDGQYYIAMEYVSGPDLFKILSRATQGSVRIPSELCLFIAAEVAKGLHYAHNARDHYGRPLHIIHRDVSPSNIIVSEAGEVKVMDFGVARATPSGQAPEQATRSGVLKGKLGYMSPEQVTGQPFDHRSDIFSLGIILYEALTLKRLFLAKTDLETLVNIRDARIEHKFKKHTYIDEGVRNILRKALARDVAERYPTAMAMHDDIMNYLYENRIHSSNQKLADFLGTLFEGGALNLNPPPLLAPNPTKPQRILSVTPDHGLPPVPPSALGVPAVPAPVQKAPPLPGPASDAVSSNSLSFSPGDMKKIRDKISERRAEQAAAMDTARPSAIGSSADGGPSPIPQLIHPSVRPPADTPADQKGFSLHTEGSAEIEVGPLRPVTSPSAIRSLLTPMPGRLEPRVSPSEFAVLARRTEQEPRRILQDGGSVRVVGLGDTTPVQTPPEPMSEAVHGGQTTQGDIDVNAMTRDMISAFHGEGQHSGDHGSYNVVAAPEPSSVQQSPRPPTSGAIFRLRTGDRKEFGPLDQTNLEAMLRSRTASPDDLVAVGDQPFQPIRAVPVLQAVVRALTAASAAPVLQGPLSQWAFVRLVYRAYSERSMGCLELRRGDAVKSIYFRRGRTQYIASNQQAELLGPFMVANGFISQADIEMAMAKARQTGGRLGDLLIGLNLIKPFQLYQVLERQLRAKFIDAFGWTDGQFAFYNDVAPPDDIVPLDIDPLTVLAEGVRERVSLAVLEPLFEDRLDRPFYRTRSPAISVGALRLQARETKALGLLLNGNVARPAYEELFANRPMRLALLHVFFLLLQTDILTFDRERA